MLPFCGFRLLPARRMKPSWLAHSNKKGLPWLHQREASAEEKCSTRYARNQPGCLVFLQQRSLARPMDARAHLRPRCHAAWQRQRRLIRRSVLCVRQLACRVTAQQHAAEHYRSRSPWPHPACSARSVQPASAHPGLEHIGSSTEISQPLEGPSAG